MRVRATTRAVDIGKRRRNIDCCRGLLLGCGVRCLYSVWVHCPGRNQLYGSNAREFMICGHTPMPHQDGPNIEDLAGKNPGSRLSSGRDIFVRSTIYSTNSEKCCGACLRDLENVTGFYDLPDHIE